MENGMEFNMEEEFASLDFNSSRLERRFIKSMETLSKQPDKSIWFSSENRAGASGTKFPQQFTGCWAMKTLTGKKRCGRTGRQRLGA